MGFGALLASNGKLLSPKLMGLVTEVRVEQFLDDSTKFAVRFADDWCGGAPLVRGDKSLEIGCTLAIVVRDETGDVCLVEGPIEDEASMSTTGGPGSWHQIGGRDRRALLEGDVIQASYEGRASDVATAILKQIAVDDVDAEHTAQIYDKKGTTLNQSATDLAFVTQLARDHCYGLWLRIEVSHKAATLSFGKRTAHFRTSPPASPGAKTLAPPAVKKLVVERDSQSKCVNVTQFQLEKDSKRAAKATAKAVDVRSGKSELVEGQNLQAAIERKGLSLEKLGWPTRAIKPVSAGGTDELNKKLSAAVCEESWFVKATLSTTMHLVDRALAPHDLVEVVATAEADRGLYQVKTVTHVINAADHFMDVELRRNALLGARA